MGVHSEDRGAEIALLRGKCVRRSHSSWGRYTAGRRGRDGSTGRAAGSSKIESHGRHTAKEKIKTKRSYGEFWWRNVRRNYGRYQWRAPIELPTRELPRPRQRRNLRHPDWPKWLWSSAEVCFSATCTPSDLHQFYMLSSSIQRRVCGDDVGRIDMMSPTLPVAEVPCT